MKKTLKNPFLILSFLIISSTLIITFTNFNSWESLKGLLYPTMTESEIEGSKKNVLEVLAFESVHLPNKEYHFNEKNVSISQLSREFTSPSSLSAGGGTPYKVESNDDMKNIVLQAQGSNFVGWSGCDASTDSICQISVTNHQKRKIEAHYSVPEPSPSLQLFSVSNNKIEGELSENWLEAHPRLAYKASHNLLKGNLPENLGDLSADLQLNLGGNNFAGEIPETIGGLGSIDYVGLYNNNLEGNIPEEIGGLNPIYFLAFMNNLQGPIPPEIGSMSRAERFELHDNQLSETVPVELIGIGSLTPNELRLHNNNLQQTAPGLMSDAPWEGVNFYNNSFSKGSILNSLSDAAEGGGSYINFCGNAPVIHAHYSADGKTCNLDVPDQLNQAVNSWGEIYVEVTLNQTSPYYDGSCRGECTGTVRTTEVCDDDCIGEGGTNAECCSDEEYCHYSSFCNPNESTASYWPLGFSHLAGSYCIVVTEEIYECEDIDHIPDTVNHAAEYPGCDYWTHGECRPICNQGSCGGGTVSNNCRPNDSNWFCEPSGDYGDGRDNSETEPDGYQQEC